MTQSIPLKIKARDIAIGFFGWVIISNLIFTLFLNSVYFIEGNEKSMELIVNIIWLLAIAIGIVLIVKKRNWVSVGIVIAVIINITLWIIVLFSMGLMEGLTLETMIVNIGIPLPIGIVFVLMS